MNAPLYLLYPRLYRLTEEYRPTEEQMPWAYSIKNPDNRSRHGDWFFFKSTPRIDTARRIPLPLRQIDGVCIPTPMKWDVTYPLSPGHTVFDHEYYPGMRFPHVMVDCAGEGWSRFAFWHHDRWEPCVIQYKRTFNIPFVGKRVLKFYHGLKQDVTLWDAMGWLEPAMSLTKES